MERPNASGTRHRSAAWKSTTANTSRNISAATAQTTQIAENIPCGWVRQSESTYLLIFSVLSFQLALAFLSGDLLWHERPSHEHPRTKRTSSPFGSGSLPSTTGPAREAPFESGLGTSGTVWGAFPFDLGIGCAELVREVGTGGAGARRVTTISYSV